METENVPAPVEGNVPEDAAEDRAKKKEASRVIFRYLVAGFFMFIFGMFTAPLAFLSHVSHSSGLSVLYMTLYMIGGLFPIYLGISFMVVSLLFGALRTDEIDRSVRAGMMIGAALLVAGLLVGMTYMLMFFGIFLN